MGKSLNISSKTSLGSMLTASVQTKIDFCKSKLNFAKCSWPVVI